MTYVYSNRDCMEWMQERKENSVHAIVTDPPYGVIEFSPEQIQKMNTGKGGIWRMPPKIGGSIRNPLPRFSVINDDATLRERVFDFFYGWGQLAYQILVPGGHMIVASTPLLSDIVSRSMRKAGFERRGELVRVVKTLRGGDRPKNSELEFQDVSVMPRGCWEPWGIFRKPLSEKTIAKNLKKWNTGGLRRISEEQPFFDLIFSEKTPKKEREIANHPNIKPQRFLRQVVRAVLPMGVGIVYDPFAGSGSTLAAAEALGYESNGTEINEDYYKIGVKAIPLLKAIIVK